MAWNTAYDNEDRHQTYTDPKAAAYRARRAELAEQDRRGEDLFLKEMNKAEEIYNRLQYEKEMVDYFERHRESPLWKSYKYKRD